MGDSNSASKKQVICDRCSKSFTSKNALFRHLKASIGSSNSCLRQDEVSEFMEMVVNREENFEKIAILYGYIPSDFYLQREINVKDVSTNECWGLQGGDHAAQLLQESAQEVSLGSKANLDMKINRSYGCQSRSKDIQDQLCQDENTGALTEILCMRLPSLCYDEGESQEDKKLNETEAIQKWVDSVNAKLIEKIMGLNPGMNYCHTGKIKVFGRLTVKKKFNAEMDVSHRRIDYILPADLIYGPKVERIGHSLGQFCDNMISFSRGQTVEQSNKHGLLTYLHGMKRLMQSFCTQFVEVEIEPSTTEVGDCGKETKEDSCEDLKQVTRTSKNKKRTKKTKIGRRRYHNFTPRMMAHEYLAYRRLDRFFHRATVRANEFKSSDLDIGIQTQDSKPFIVLSLKGDLFLNGLPRALIGLFVAIVLGYIDEDIIQCIFDEDYTNLVPAPLMPLFAQFSAEAWYTSWEGKLKFILCPRSCNDYGGWNTQAVLTQLELFQEEMHSAIMRSWNSCDTKESVGIDKRLTSCTNWIKEYLEPWSKRANEELAYYRKWKEAKRVVQESNSKSMTIATALLPPLDSISADIPKLYAKVLHHLKNINNANLWPSTTPKRQLVMVATSEGSEGYESLVVSHIKAQSNNPERESAYSFKEGEGGASGSFSVGAMPGSQCEQPKGNTLFPELMKAAFELEIALCPDREPSSTIAINRNAQFRPHVDNGAGAGQSRSLIVGLGTYVGGELMVEGQKHCIRYKPLEFNGWTERHWTLPFHGERFSLVWFTPKGCEGIRGIDLCK